MRLLRPSWCVGAAVGLVLDRCWGEPPSRVHPLVFFGRALNGVEARWYRDRRSAGVAHALVGAALGASAGWLVRSTAAATYVAVGGRALGDAARDVGDALNDGELARARALLPALVGRDSRSLAHGEIARAVVESVGENTVDAIVAPVLWAALLGPVGALGYRALNTMDAMVGHHTARYERYGWASARLDDVANWVPARVTAALVALVRPGRVRTLARSVVRQAPLHPSPNSGVAEAAFAAALDLCLGGRNDYGERVEVRPVLGYGVPAQARDVARSVRLSRDVSYALTLTLVVVALARVKR